jgi:hypothetical protein
MQFLINPNGICCANETEQINKVTANKMFLIFIGETGLNIWDKKRPQHIAGGVLKDHF